MEMALVVEIVGVSGSKVTVEMTGFGLFVSQLLIYWMQEYWK